FHALSFADAGLLNNAQIPSLLPWTVIEDAMTEFPRFGLRPNVWLRSIELCERFPSDFESRERIVDKIMRQEIGNAEAVGSGRLSDLHHVLKLCNGEIIQHDLACCCVVECRAAVE